MGFDEFFLNLFGGVFEEIGENDFFFWLYLN